MTFEEMKHNRREENKKLKQYLKGYLPEITKDIAIYRNGDRYKMSKDGWRKLPKEI